MLIQMLAQPSSGGIGSSPRGMLARRRELPYITQYMGHPSSCVIEGFRGPLPTRDLSLRPFDHRKMKLGEIGHLSGPQIHLQIDIQMIIPIPRRMDRITPQPLQVRGKQSGACRGDQQITPELKVQGRQSRIVFILGESRQPPVDWQPIPLAPAQVQGDPVK